MVQLRQERVLLTALGLNPKSCLYVLGEKSAEAVLAPLALLELKKEWQPDQVVALVTERAREETLSILEKGCQERVEGGVSVVSVNVELEGEGGLSALIERVGASIPTGCELVIDFTHGPRHIPLLSYAIALYAGSLKGVTLTGAWYGMIIRNENRAPLLDLRPVLELPQWFFALETLQRQGHSPALSERFLELARPVRECASKNRALFPEASRLEGVGHALRQLSFAVGAGLPLEVGRRAQQLLETINDLSDSARHVPQAEALLEHLRSAVEGLSSDALSKDKRKAILDDAELERQVRLIDHLLDGSQWSLALGLMREWVVSRCLPREARGGWLERLTRQPVSHKLVVLEKAAEGESRERLSEDARVLGRAWKVIREARNALHHHGMNPSNYIEAPSAVLDHWKRLKTLERFDLEVGGGGHRKLLICPLGRKPGVLYSALLNTRPSAVLVLCSDETRKGIAEAVEQARRQTGDEVKVFEHVFKDPFADFEGARALAEEDELCSHILVADEVVGCITGGTTLLGFAVQILNEFAKLKARPCRRLALVDRRPNAEQAESPWVQSECVWLDSP